MPRKPNDILATEMEKLAKLIAEEALRTEVTVSDRNESFKLLTAYFVGTRKIKAKPTDEDDDTETFSDMKKHIRAVT